MERKDILFPRRKPEPSDGPTANKIVESVFAIVTEETNIISNKDSSFNTKNYQRGDSNLIEGQELQENHDHIILTADQILSTKLQSLPASHNNIEIATPNTDNIQLQNQVKSTTEPTIEANTIETLATTMSYPKTTEIFLPTVVTEASNDYQNRFVPNNIFDVIDHIDEKKTTTEDTKDEKQSPSEIDKLVGGRKKKEYNYNNCDQYDQLMERMRCKVFACFEDNKYCF